MKRVITVLLLTLTAFAAPTQHQAALAWTQSSSAGLTSNCVYRSQTSGGPYTQLFCSTAPITNYTDLTVAGGQTYFYVVTALVGSEESPFSNEAKAVIPLSPSAPSGLSAVAQ